MNIKNSNLINFIKTNIVDVISVSRNFSQYFVIFIMLLFLTACSSETCIDADDFGFAKVDVSSRYPIEEQSKLNPRSASQVGAWYDSTYRVNGRPLLIMVKYWQFGLYNNTPAELSAWSPWYGTEANEATLSDLSVRLQDCVFANGEMCTNTQYAQIGNAPCILRKGIGLYGLIASRGTNPNASMVTKRSPDGITFHLGEPTDGYTLYDVDKYGSLHPTGGILYQYAEDGHNASDLKRQFASSNLYFKILDRYYNDNSGKYRVIIKSGVNIINKDPLTYLTNLVKQFLFGVSPDTGNGVVQNLIGDGSEVRYGVIKNIYLGIIENPGYRLAVSSALTLYIMFLAFAFLSGNIELTKTELIVRVTKIAIVSALLSSEYSWSFFYDYLFVLFIDGLDQIINMIMSASTGGSGATSILALMISNETLAKLLSLLFADWRGFLYIIAFLIILTIVVLVFLQATIIYLLALIFIGIIIAMGPIFICFMLFERTNSLFQNWLKQLISYAIQPIILFTGIALISIILRQEIYGSLGFKVCQKYFPSIAEGGMGIFNDEAKKHLGVDLSQGLFHWWFPAPMKGENFTRNKVAIPVPIDHYANESLTNSGDENSFCEAYSCIEERYPDLPYLDPDKDQRRINQFWNGQFVQFDGLLLIVVALYLLHKFNNTAVNIARFITGTSANLTRLTDVAPRIDRAAYSSAYLVGRKLLSKARSAASSGLRMGLQGVRSAQGAATSYYKGKTLDYQQNKDLKNQSEYGQNKKIADILAATRNLEREYSSIKPNNAANIEKRRNIKIAISLKRQLAQREYAKLQDLNDNMRNLSKIKLKENERDLTKLRQRRSKLSGESEIKQLDQKIQDVKRAGQDTKKGLSKLTEKYQIEKEGKFTIYKKISKAEKMALRNLNEIRKVEDKMYRNIDDIQKVSSANSVRSSLENQPVRAQASILPADFSIYTIDPDSIYVQDMLNRLPPAQRAILQARIEKLKFQQDAQLLRKTQESSNQHDANKSPDLADIIYEKDKVKLYKQALEESKLSGSQEYLDLNKKLNYLNNQESIFLNNNKTSNFANQVPQAERKNMTSKALFSSGSKTPEANTLTHQVAQDRDNYVSRMNDLQQNIIDNSKYKGEDQYRAYEYMHKDIQDHINQNPSLFQDSKEDNLTVYQVFDKLEQEGHEPPPDIKEVIDSYRALSEIEDNKNEILEDALEVSKELNNNRDQYNYTPPKQLRRDFTKPKLNR